MVPPPLDLTNICSICSVYTPQGTQRITKVRQVGIPKVIMEAVGLLPGDEVYLQVNPDHPKTLLLIPADVLMVWLEAGRATNPNAEAPTDEPQPRKFDA